MGADMSTQSIKSLSTKKVVNKPIIKKSPVKKVVVKKSPVKKVLVKKSPSKKVVVKKSPTKTVKHKGGGVQRKLISLLRKFQTPSKNRIKNSIIEEFYTICPPRIFSCKSSTLAHKSNKNIDTLKIIVKVHNDIIRKTIEFIKCREKTKILDKSIMFTVLVPGQNVSSEMNSHELIDFLEKYFLISDINISEDLTPKLIMSEVLIRNLKQTFYLYEEYNNPESLYIFLEKIVELWKKVPKLYLKSAL